jgi:glycogen debranching enzyme
MGTFALAAVYEGGPAAAPRIARVVASDAGHLLDSSILDGDDARGYRDAVVRRLMAPDMLASTGLRTKSVGAPRFNPGAYHNGSVWPMDNGRIAGGLRRYGYEDEADELERRVLYGCAVAGSMVEYFRGDTDGGIRVNAQPVEAEVLGECRVVEPRAQPNQGWTASCVWRSMRRRGLL